MSSEEFRGGAVPPIDTLPIVGKSWFRRGFSYWLRRTWVVFFLLFASVMVAAMDVGITYSIVRSGAPAWVVVPLVVAAGLTGTLWLVRSSRRNLRDETVQDWELVSEDVRRSRGRGRSRGAGAGGAGAGLGVFGGLGALMIAVCAFFAVGFFPFMLWYMLKPLLAGELRARRKVARWLTLQGRTDEIPRHWTLS